MKIEKDLISLTKMERNFEFNFGDEDKKFTRLGLFQEIQKIIVFLRNVNF